MTRRDSAPTGAARRRAHHQALRHATTATIIAVDDVSFAVAPGEFVSIIGPSGCGKSTLFNIIGGLIGDYDGRVTVDGETRHGHASGDRHGVPGGVDVSVAHRRWTTSRSRSRSPASPKRERHRARRAFHRAGRPLGLRAPLSRRALGRHAPARRDRAHARLRAAHPADGRAVRGARRADAPAARRQGAADPAGAAADHAAHHAQPDRGRAALRPRAGHDVSAGTLEARRSTSTCRIRATRRSSAATRSAITSPRSGRTCARRRAAASPTTNRACCSRARER